MIKSTLFPSVSNIQEPMLCVESHVRTDELNFNLPLPPVIETRRVTLTPFIPAIHGEAFFKAYKAGSPAIGQYLPVSFPTYEAFLQFLEGIASDPNGMLFAIIDRTKPMPPSADISDSLAGAIGLLDTNRGNRTTEIAPAIVLPKFQRTFIATNAIGALLKYCLDVPSEGGLGLRRVCWTAHPDNLASIKAAERMGMRKEGYLRWTWALTLEKIGKVAGKERGERLGRDSVLLAICWDDWEDGAKEKVEQLIERP
ncbi:hypothetical protein H0H81_005572 [Sphagnurus paluster]|uniref:N-acetyltransferase domain-containing protein n=1 Tax=Sphagnurus paluster TaxID=117069 RepID=A0A9P7K5I8_9AGAR|nr:hypothetical protein H0H81_005572 [Sphagnurus paluster]